MLVVFTLFLVVPLHTEVPNPIPMSLRFSLDAMCYTATEGNQTTTGVGYVLGE